MAASGPEGPAASVVIQLFGGFDVRRNGAPLPPLRSRKGQWLLALLALRHGREVERVWLAGMLWPESPESQGLSNLRRSLTDLRSALGSEADRLRSPTPHTLTLEVTGAVVDVAAFDEWVQAGDRTSLERAVALYRGPLLEGCEEEWAFQERQAREQAYLRALEALAIEALMRTEPQTAERLLRQAVAVDPLRETAQRALMQALAAGGNYAAALLAYRELRLRLHRDLRAEPDPETTALFQRIRLEARGKAAGPVDREARRLQRRARPEPISQLAAPELPAGFPSLPSLEARPNNLPLPLTRFIGRERELMEVKRLLATRRLVTLTGAGGCGKTRLALQAAADRLEEHADGIWLVDLAPLADDALVPQAVAGSLGVIEAPGFPLATTLAAALKNRRILLLLDNCEHLVAACATLTETLLQSCAHLSILTTSREPLGITGEALCRVPPLAVPDLQPPPTPESLLHCEAVRLFIERALTAQPAFTVTRENALAVAQVCRRLDGIPLAIELAAAQMRVLPVGEIAARLDDRFRLLTRGSRTALPRHRTLRAQVDWSYDLLTEPEQVLLRRLSVFAGGWVLEAAEAVCSDFGLDPTKTDGSDLEAPLTLPAIQNPKFKIQNQDTLGLLAQLVDKSLVIYETRAPEGSEARYRLLETVRQYGRERLSESGEAETVRWRHRDFFLRLAETADTHLRGSEQLAWLKRLDEEHSNLRAALEGCLKAVDSGQWVVDRPTREEAKIGSPASEPTTIHQPPTPAAETGLRLAAALSWFWVIRSHFREGRQWLEEALSRGGNGSPSLRARALAGAAHLAVFDHSAAAEGLAAEAVRLARETGERRILAEVLDYLGREAIERGDFDRAASLGEESLAIARDLGDRWLIAVPLLLLGMVARSQGDLEAATTFLSESLGLVRQVGDRWLCAITLNWLGTVAEARGNETEAAALAREGMALCREMADQRGMAWFFHRLAWAATGQGRGERAVRLLGAAETLHEDSGGSFLSAPSQRPVVVAGDPAAAGASVMRAAADHALESARAMLDEAAFAAAWEAGRAMTRDHAIAFALEEAD